MSDIAATADQCSKADVGFLLSGRAWRTKVGFSDLAAKKSSRTATGQTQKNIQAV